MKRTFVWTCVLVTLILGAGIASAQNTDFKGFYVGGYMGGAHGSANARTSTIFDAAGYFNVTSVPAIAAAGNQELSSKGFNAGGTFGYNWQPSRWVFGGEVDFGSLHISDQRGTGAVPYPCCPPSSFNISQKVKSNWLLTARPRAGYTWGKWMVFGTAGLAVANVQYRALFTDTFASAHESAAMNPNMIGWTAGAGFEYKAQRHWSLKGEYLYASFSDNSVQSTNLTAFSGIMYPTNVFTHTTDFNAHIVRGGLNYHF